MRDTTRRGKDPKYSQEMLQVLLDLTRFSRQATASEALETKALELLHYLLARCQASRGAIVLLDPPQQVKISFRPLALEHIQEAEIRALLTPGGVSHRNCLKSLGKRTGFCSVYLYFKQI